MSHVDEGMLHAYLDGALDTLPAAEAERVRRHLSECDVCQGRLQEVRAVRDEAAAILGGASLEMTDLPSFEEVRALARGTATRSGFRLQKLAWAASVVLALGTGWLLRGGGLPVPDGEATASAPVVTGGRGEADEAEAAVVGAVRTPEQERTDRPDVPSPAGVAATPVPEAAAGDTSRPAEDAPRPAELWAAARQRREPSVAQVITPSSPTASEALASRASLVPVAEEARTVVSRAGSDFSARDDALAVGGGSLIVPGLSVVSVARLEETELAGGVRVLQLMENGDTLELVHIPAGVDPALLQAVGDGRTQLLSPRAGGWLVLRARASADVLAGLVRRLGGGD